MQRNGVILTKISPRNRSKIRSCCPSSTSLVLVTLFVITLILCSLRGLLGDAWDPVGCDMTYMRPQYIHLNSFNSSITRFSPKYNLYLYRDYAVSISSSAAAGVPVLFLPGNGGSYQQARSVASETYLYARDHLPLENKKNFDFFTIDFNEELSGLHGMSLFDQAEYTNDAIRYVLNNYYDFAPETRPKAVIIIGHSMGGVVARTLPITTNYQPNSVSTIITLATPHLAPPGPLDYNLWKLYQSINKFWVNSHGNNRNKSTIDDLILISIAGGNHDSMVPSFLSMVDEIVPKSHGLSVFSSGIPDVWVASDHQCIVWCNQLVKKIAKCLFEIVDSHLPSQVISRERRLAIFSENLLRNPGDIEKETLFIDNHDVHYEYVTKYGKMNLVDSTATHTRFKFGDLINGRILIMLHTLPSDKQYQLCNKTYSEMEYICLNLSNSVEKIPLDQTSSVKRRKFYLITVSAADLKKWQYLLVKKNGMDTNMVFQLESDLRYTVSLFSLLSGGFTRNLVLKNSSFTNISLSLPFPSILAFKFYLTDISEDGKYPFVVKQVSSYFGETKFWTNPSLIYLNYFTYSIYHKNYLNEPKTNVYLELHYGFNVENTDFYITIDFIGTLTNIIRRYVLIGLFSPLLIHLLIMHRQFKHFLIKDEFPNTLHIASQIFCEKKWHLFTVGVAISQYFIGDRFLERWIGIEYILIPLFFIIGIGLLIIVHLVASFVTSLLSLLIPTRSLLSKKISSAVFAVVICLSCIFFIPHQVAYLICVVTYVFQTANAKKLEFSGPFVNLHLSYLVLFLLCIPFSGPALIVWLKNLSIGWSESKEHNILYIIPTVLFVCIDHTLIFNGKKPRINRLTSSFVFGIAFILTLLNGMRTTWILMDAVQIVLTLTIYTFIDKIKLWNHGQVKAN